jgi:hypothetical protein
MRVNTLECWIVVKDTILIILVYMFCNYIRQCSLHASWMPVRTNIFHQGLGKIAGAVGLIQVLLRLALAVRLASRPTIFFYKDLAVSSSRNIFSSTVVL